MIIKVIAVATMAIAASPTSTLAQSSYFSDVGPIEAGQVVYLGLVHAEADGIVEIYNYRMGRREELLGTGIVRRGANQHVRVRMQQLVTSDNVFAVLNVNGVNLAQAKYPIRQEE